MAHFNIDVPQDLMKKIVSVEENMPTISEKMLETGAEEMYRAMKSSVPVRTGNTANALYKTDVFMDKYGEPCIKIGFNGKYKTGKGRKGTRYSDIAFWNEFGNVHQPPRPFFRTAWERGQNGAAERMRRKFKELTGIDD